MRLAIVSDIHSNLEALNSALAVIDREGPDEIICLGDTVGYGANPNECLGLVRERCSLVLLGNHDAAAIDLSEAQRFTLNAQLSAHWTFNALSEEHKSYLRTLTPSHHRNDILFTHASPFEEKEWHYVVSTIDAREAFDVFTERICFLGHSHIPVIFSERGKTGAIDAAGRFIVNVGSVGQPRDGNPELSFGVFDTDAWSYRNIRAPYDIRSAANKIRAAGLPRTLAERIFHGM